MLRKFEFPELLSSDTSVTISTQEGDFILEETNIESLALPSTMVEEEALLGVVTIREEEKQAYGEERYQQGYQEATQHYLDQLAAREQQAQEEKAVIIAEIQSQCLEIRQLIKDSRAQVLMQLEPVWQLILQKLCIEALDTQKHIQQVIAKALEIKDLDGICTLTVPLDQIEHYKHALAALPEIEGCMFKVRGEASLTSGKVMLAWQEGAVMLDHPNFLEQMEALIRQIQLSNEY